MTTDRDLLLRHLDGELPPAEARALEARLERDAALRAERDRLAALRDALRASAPEAFAPHFADRVMRRLRPAGARAAEPNGAEALYAGLRWAFARAAVAGLLAAGALGAYNVADFGDLGVATTLVETVFGLPSATLLDALDYATL